MNGPKHKAALSGAGLHCGAGLHMRRWHAKTLANRHNLINLIDLHAGAGRDDRTMRKPWKIGTT
jgi:hypothetical protein